MTFGTTSLIQAVCTATLAAVTCGASADTIELTNGDVLTGTVIEQTDQGVTLDHAILGKITLQAGRIASVKISDAKQPAAETKTPDADAKRSEASGTAPDPKATEQAALEAAAEDRSFWQRFREDWDSKLTLGLNGSTGPTDRQNYRVKFKTGFEDGRDRISFDTSWYYATADGNQSQNQFQANLTKDWLQKDEPWFFFVKGQYKFDNNRSWENRTSAFGGGGYTLTKTEDVEVNTRLGFGGTYEYGSVNDFTPEALFGGSVVKWHVSERAAIAGQTLYYPSLEDTANFRIESSLEWTYKLDMADGLSLKLGVENEYDSATPNETGNNDVRYYGAVVLSF
ncbi:MAG: DUF481 domain-containing protein [Phycisphaeraceae bacterium]|nr:DUF481 domain-containing protein [Phycisphaeraceae bacterium]